MSSSRFFKTFLDIAVSPEPILSSADVVQRTLCCFGTSSACSA